MKTNKELLMQIVTLYYEQNLTQSEIAKIYGISRPTVSRMLVEAKENGIVEIKINSPIRLHPALSKELRAALPLKNALVVAGKFDEDTALRQCAKAGANFLHSILQNNMILGTSWGTALNYLSDALEPKPYYNVHVAQMAGCLGTGNPHEDGMELAMKLSEKLGGSYSNIHAPLFIDNELVYRHLIEEPSIDSSIKTAARADIILSGIGSVNSSSTMLEKNGYITEKERVSLLEGGCAGHINARFYDKSGNEMSLKNRFVVSVSLEAIKTAAWRIGICSAKNKADAAYCAVKSGYINTLIIGEDLARDILELALEKA